MKNQPQSLCEDPYCCQEPAYPYNLKSTQEWFANIITNKLGQDDTIQTYGSEGLLVAEEACQYVAPSPTLTPHLRMQIYNQQYWWRLLNTLHTNFPLVTRLFGRNAFNEDVGIPYLLKYPPNHWSLYAIGERLPKWVSENYHEKDQTLVYHAAELDWAFTSVFISGEEHPLDLPHLVKKNPEKLLEYPLHLQPHIHLFSWDYDLLTFRQSFLEQNEDYWIENRFPELPKGKTYRFVLYRNAKNHAAWREISEGEFLFLKHLKTGASIEETCTFMEGQDNCLYEETASHMQEWLQRWTQLGWLVQK